MSAVSSTDLGLSTLQPGSPAHKHLLAQFFFDTHLRYDPEHITWPELSEAELARLQALPFWQEAVSTENITSNTVTAAAQLEADPELARAIALQGFEEQRHARLLAALTAHYGISIEVPAPYEPRKLEDDFLFAGFGECFDSFFAFGLFSLARESGFFPDPLVTVFDPVMQEEARHILFFINWVTARRRELHGWRRPAFRLHCGWIILKQVASRIKTAREIGAGQNQPANSENFTLTAHQEIGADITLHRLLERCLAENERRLAPYDARLLRPRLVPGIARLLLRILPKSI